jgi:molecular chaperone GrpE
MSPASDSASHRDEPERVVIRDKRRVDVPGEAGAAARGAGPAPAPAEPAPEADQEPMVQARLLDERTADLQRVQAEYANYRKRADRERAVAGEIAVSRTLIELLPVLDDLDRARAHGDLTGGLKAIADRLDSVFAKVGVEAFGEVGDGFDPAIHEAVLHDVSDAVSAPTCTNVLRQGYRYRDRLLRPAMVGVTDPAGPAPSDAGESAAEPDQTQAVDSVDLADSAGSAGSPDAVD